jgi:hypothetical protein
MKVTAALETSAQASRPLLGAMLPTVLATIVLLGFFVSRLYEAEGRGSLADGEPPGPIEPPT